MIDDRTGPMTICEYFGRVLIISLRSRPDRRRDIARELKTRGIAMAPGKIEFFDAIRPDEAGGFPSIGLRGCFLSHLEILRAARDAHAPRVLILEDDAQISRRFVAQQGRLIGQLQADDWDIAYFGHLIEVARPGSGETELIPHSGPIDLTHFYAVNGPMLDRLVGFLEACLTRPPGDPRGGPMSPDGAFSFFREQNPDVRTLIAAPNLGWQRSSRTDGHALRWFDRAPVVRDAVALARRARAMAGSFR